MQSAIEFDNSYGRLPERFFARLDPKPVRQPELIKLNEELADELGLDAAYLRSEQGVAALAGNARLEGSDPLAMAYAGQQFGNWVPQLGDGRALLLGEVIDRAGIRRDIQLKGSGPTPFSRMGDGRAWLGPVLREYIVSEAMFALGVPTTRALAAVATGESVVREEVLPGAILTRVSKAHIRVGTFQYFAARRDDEGLKQLADYAIDRLYPDLKDIENPYPGLLDRVIEAQASLVAKWMNLGFIHGVMNTDNVSIAGETIDYGPCAFMDDFHPDRVFSSIDQHGRYAYSNQPRIAHWNLVQFAQALLPLFGNDEKHSVEQAQLSINAYPGVYQKAYQSGLNAKLGLAEIRDGDADLSNELLKLMAENKADFTLAFRLLSRQDLSEFKGLFEDQAGLTAWLDQWQPRLDSADASIEQSRDLMVKSNPAFIPRNHRIEQAIRAALEDDIDPFHRLCRVLATPFEDQAEEIDLTLPPQPKEIVPYTFCGT
ncbi:MAG: protein adenylyltransferase SelO [Rhizobiaceae bacterium]